MTGALAQYANANALKYTESGGKVRVQLNAAEKNVFLVVEDTGIGIPAESLPRIFDRFYRVNKSRSCASGGIGLKLSIVKAIAEAHKGTVQRSEHRGARYSVHRQPSRRLSLFEV